jgi:hypothetical protein
MSADGTVGDVTEQLFGHAVVMLAMIGLVINIGAFVILHKKNRKTLFHQLLKFLSIYDILVGLGGAIGYGLPTIWPHFKQEILPRIAPILVPLIHIALMTSVYTTIVISLERYVRICFLCQMRQSSCCWVTEDNLKYFLTGLVVIPTIFYIPKFFEFNWKKTMMHFGVTLDCEKIVKMAMEATRGQNNATVNPMDLKDCLNQVSVRHSCLFVCFHASRRDA